MSTSDRFNCLASMTEASADGSTSQTQSYKYEFIKNLYDSFSAAEKLDVIKNTTEHLTPSVFFLFARTLLTTTSPQKSDLIEHVINHYIQNKNAFLDTQCLAIDLLTEWLKISPNHKVSEKQMRNLLVPSNFNQEYQNSVQNLLVVLNVDYDVMYSIVQHLSYEQLIDKMLPQHEYDVMREEQCIKNLLSSTHEVFCENWNFLLNSLSVQQKIIQRNGVSTIMPQLIKNQKIWEEVLQSLDDNDFKKAISPKSEFFSNALNSYFFGPLASIETPEKCKEILSCLKMTDWPPEERTNMMQQIIGMMFSDIGKRPTFDRANHVLDFISKHPVWKDYLTQAPMPAVSFSELAGLEDDIDYHDYEYEDEFLAFNEALSKKEGQQWLSFVQQMSGSVRHCFSSVAQAFSISNMVIGGSESFEAFDVKKENNDFVVYMNGDEALKNIFEIFQASSVRGHISLAVHNEEAFTKKTRKM